MFTEGGLGGTEGTIRPGVFPRVARLVVPAMDASGNVLDDHMNVAEIPFDERGQVLMTYEALYNFVELAGWRFIDQADIQLVLPLKEFEEQVA